MEKFKEEGGENLSLTLAYYFIEKYKG